MRSYEGSESASGGRTRTANEVSVHCDVADQSGRVCVRTDFDGRFGFVVCVTDCAWHCGDLCDEGGASGGLWVHGDHVGAERGGGHVRRR